MATTAGVSAIDVDSGQCIGLFGTRWVSPLEAFVSGAIAPAFRSRGLGRHLLRLVLGEHPDVPVWIHCADPDTPAAALLRSEGFSPIEVDGVTFVHDLSAKAHAVATPGAYTLTVTPGIPEDARPAVRALETIWCITHDQPVGPELIDDFERVHDGFIVIARHGDNVVGLASAYRTSAPGQGSTGFLIVDPDHRGQGLAQALKAAQLQGGRDAGWTRIVHSVPKSAPAAIAVNRKFGPRELTDLKWKRPPRYAATRDSGDG